MQPKQPAAVLVSVLAVCLFLIQPVSSTPPLRYVENFTTTQFRDSVETTAWWDTTSGQLRLYPFTPGLASQYNTAGVALGVAVAGIHAFVADNTIRYDVPAGDVDVILEIVDVRGRRLRTLVTGRQAPGRHSVNWDGSDEQGQPVATGVYFYRLKAAGFTETRKMVLLK
jgi:hypothetical protein